MKYKVGDKVFLGAHTWLAGYRVNWNSAMDIYVGKAAKITRLSRRYDHRLYWQVDIDGGQWEWCEENFNACPCNVNSCLRHKKR
jgi:hypothetical protein